MIGSHRNSLTRNKGGVCRPERSENLYEKFEQLLQEKGVTAYSVSKETGVATSTLTEWKKGTYTPKVDKLMLIAAFFNVPVDYFLNDKEVQP